MPEGILQPILEGFFQVVCYFTAKPLLPMVSFRTVRAEAITRNERPFPWHGFKRAADGTVIMQAEWVSVVGLLIWVGAVIAIVLLWI